ncbi:MAG: helix-turn-helix transcriptional regulator [Cypionkella sp.]|jgi:DNA-binding CsgD family transcriptional regulator/PAS domain-containing protein
MTDHALIARIYDCAMQPDLWPEVLQDLADRAGAHGAMIFDRALYPGGEHINLQVCSTTYDPEIVLGYVARYNPYEVDDQAQFARLSTRGDEVNLIRCDDLRPSRAVLERQPNVQAMMGMGIHFRAGALLSKDTDAMDRFALQLRRSQGPIAEPARQWVEALLPHVAKAMSIGRAFFRQGNDNRLLIEIIEALPFGVAIVHRDGTPLLANGEFARLADLYHLRRTGQVKLNLPSLPPALRQLLSSTDAHGQHGARPRHEAVFLPGKIEGQGLFLEVGPISQQRELDRFGPDVFLISALDSARSHSINPEVVKRFFPISASELEVLDLVVKGMTNAEIAEVRGRSPETVNSQMKSLIRKSGTRNRTELVRLAVGLSVAGLSHTDAARALSDS